MTRLEKEKEKERKFGGEGRKGKKANGILSQGAGKSLDIREAQVIVHYL